MLRRYDVARTLIRTASDPDAAMLVGLLSTVSAFLVLSPADRGAALASVLDALPREVDVVGDIRLHLARRV